MKQLIALLTFTVAAITSTAQSIAPNTSQEYCPNTNYNFVVTVPGTITSVTPSGDCQLVGGLVANAFTGRFADANSAQSFTVNYTANDGSSQQFPFAFKRIKSLSYSTTCAQVPNQAAVLAPRCQVVNIPITVPNVQWGTNFESPTLCFGSTSSFEYQIPNGWNISGQPSNGSNWIPGGNSVTVTSDLSNGIGGVILVRPRNTCAAGLQNGQAPGQIPINRPAPTLTIASTQDYICNTGQIASFTMNGMPAGSTIVWQLSDATNATIVGCSTCTTVTVQKATNFTGFVNLTATVSHCSFTYPVGPKQIALGTGRTTVFFSQLNPTCEVPSRAYFYGTVEAFTSVTNYDWYAKDMTNASNPFVLKQTGLLSTADFPLGSKGNRYYTIRVIATTPCGNVSTIDAEGLIWAPSCSGGGARIAVSPNPAQKNINIALLTDKQLATDKSDQTNIRNIEIQDKNGNTILTSKQQGNSKQANINISTLRPDYYIIRVWTGTEWISSKLLKQ